MEQLIQTYQPTMEEHIGQLSKLTMAKDAKIRECIKLHEDTQETLDMVKFKLKENLVEGSDAPTFEAIRDEVKKVELEQQKARDLMRENKLDKNSKKKAATERTVDLKRRIEEIKEENKRMEEELNNPDLPLILRLMSLKSF